MKSIILVLLAAAAGHAAEFATGQAARWVIGQKTFTEQEPGARQDLLGGVSGLAYANDTLFVVDSNRVFSSPKNERVLVFKNLSANLPDQTAELSYDRPCPVCRGAADLVIGQTDFTTTDIGLTQSKLRTPTAVATDGRYLAVADTDNNRVLIWNSIPSTNGVPANVVLGQQNFTSASVPQPVPNASSMRGPQGVWIQDGKLFVADTVNDRVLIWNSIPTANGAAANVVIGKPDFSTFVQADLTQANERATASNLVTPVSVTSDGQRLFVSDLGRNRILIWNSIPTRNAQPADVVLGQPDMESATPNNSTKLCAAVDKDDEGNDIFPFRCEATMDFPRYALSDGQRLFVADGGNDRVLIWNSIPTQNGQTADVVIGQLGGGINQASESTDSMRTPLSLAWDGKNLYVSDAFNRRVMVYSVADRLVPYSGVRNAASREIYAVGAIQIEGTIKADDEITIKIAEAEYKYKIVADDSLATIITNLTNAINGANDGQGDPNAFATPNTVAGFVILTARAAGEAGNEIAYSVSASTGATVFGTATGAALTGGQDAAKIGPGSIVTILGDDLTDDTLSAPAGVDTLPTTLGRTQVYFDGIRAPLYFVSPAQINAQLPFAVFDRTSVNAYVRAVRNNGSVRVSTPVAVTIVPQNPGIFAGPGPDPRPAVALHGSSRATGTISVDGSIAAGDTATVKIEDREYTYTVVAEDTLAIIRDKLVELINQDPRVEAFPSGSFTRIRLRARVPGPEGNGITYGASSAGQVILSPLNISLCCANSGPVTADNPAVPGETIIIYASGLGLSSPRVEETGQRYFGPVTEPNEFVSSLAAGKTGNILQASLMQGEIGLYEVHIELNADLVTNPFSQLTIAQSTFVSNIVTIPILNPNARTE